MVGGPWRLAGSGAGIFGDSAHPVCVALGKIGAGLVRVIENRPIGTGDIPRNRKRIESVTIGIRLVLALQRAKSVHEGNRDIGKDGSSTGGNFAAGETAEKAGEEDGDVGGGTKLVEIADEAGGGVFFWLVAVAEERVRGGGRRAATASRGEGVGAAWERTKRSRCEIAFHFDPRMEEIGGVPRCFLQRVRKGKKGKEMNGIRKMKEWGSD